MANALTKDLEIMFEETVLGFDAACVVSQEAEKSYPDATAMQRAGDVFYRPQDYQANIVTGLDVSAAAQTDVIQRMVPTVYRTPDNVVYALDAKEMRDPQHRDRMGKAAALRLAAEIDTNLYATVAAQAGIVVKKVGALAWSDAATADALMMSRGIGVGAQRKMFLNPFDHLAISGDLAGRAYMGDINKSAYERSQIPDIAGFRSFRTDTVANVTTNGTVTGTTVNGAQSFTVSAMTGDLPTDNRRMTLTIAGANIANVVTGAAFTIAGVNAVHNITKADTGQLMTFRVISGAGTTTPVITPAIVATGPYQNVSAVAANSAAITFLNSATKPANVFWAQGAVALDFGRLAFPTGEGVNVMTATTKQGVPLVMAYSFNSLTAKTTIRFTTLYAATVLLPEQCGVVIANQV